MNRRWLWVTKRPIPIMLATISLALATLAVVLLVVGMETSDTTEVSGPPMVSATPTVTVTPTVIVSPSVGAAVVTARPTITVTPTVTVPITPPPGVASSAPSATVTDTVVKGKASDTLELGLLGLAAFFALIAAFFNRIKSFTGPGGIGITLADAQDASEAVADKIRARAAEVVSADRDDDLPDPESVREPASQLAIMARMPRPQDQATVLHATRDSAETAGQATALTLQYAQTLMNAASKRPADFSALARASGLSSEEAECVLVGEIPETLWGRLAEQALDKVTQTS